MPIFSSKPVERPRDLFLRAAADHHTAAQIKKGFGQPVADAFGAAGDNDHFFCLFLHSCSDL
jgi:hypothetical protein